MACPRRSNIGAAGTSTYGTAADWDGAQVLHGDFTGDRVQDFLAYRETASALLDGNGDALPLDPGTGETLYSDQFTDDYGDNPGRLVAAGNASRTGTGIADLIGTSGDAVSGYRLDLYTTCGGCGAASYAYARTLAAGSPDGDWSGFSLVTAQPAGNTVLFALKESTGELWESASADPAHLVGTPGTWTAIGVPWSSAPALISGDVNAAGHVELWSVAGAHATPYTLNGTTLDQGDTVDLW